MMPFNQEELPYDLKALAPFVSEEQMHYHYNKHHAAYFKKLNTLVEGKPESEQDLETVVKNSSGGVFNNAAQAWNHTFFWSCMSPDGGGKPSGDLLNAIERDFGSLDDFMKKFSDAAATLFGSGWAWLASDGGGNLEIMPLSNADTPLKHGKTPVLTLDVWEHAYYIDYRNERPRFIEQFRDVIHWDFAEQCYKGAQ
ncbi:Superoxide dismutase [Fe] [Candidatus Neptunochlamydia vexilliferae]|uniref:Superoxide dismutase n=2 Tax=Candidatus Neptunichlamydia vexilliferae TaxID=1651774 RepID=A0ABS0AY94_9BACT|nr:Superoxide dismutase [Fe] [Candidatus Neptunochlamydia vexilliferae]